MLKDEVISSPNNGIYKYIKSLLQKKYRERYGRYLLEGRKMVLEALSQSSKIEYLVLSDTVREQFKDIITLAEKSVNTIVLTSRLFTGISAARTPQGILAVMKINKYHMEDLNSCHSIVVLDGIRDPGNMGTIIRTSEAFGFNGIAAINDCVDPYNPKTVRSTMGSILRMPIYSLSEGVSLYSYLHNCGFHIAAADLIGMDIAQWAPDSDRIALVIGSEAHGISRLSQQQASILVNIPMKGSAESLNASVAAGILLYQVSQKLRNGLP